MSLADNKGKFFGLGAGINKARREEIPKLQEKARKSGNPQDAQELNDFVALCNRFEKKIHDLELTKVISLQMAPQIRLIQNNDSLMSEKITKDNKYNALIGLNLLETEKELYQSKC